MAREGRETGVPGAPQANTSPTFVGMSPASTTVIVWGSSVSLCHVTVSPRCTEIGPGANRSVAWIMALGTKCSVR